MLNIYRMRLTIYTAATPHVNSPDLDAVDEAVYKTPVFLRHILYYPRKLSII